MATKEEMLSKSISEGFNVVLEDGILQFQYNERDLSLEKFRKSIEKLLKENDYQSSWGIREIDELL